MAAEHSIKVGRYRINLSNEEKIFFPKTKITKGDLIAYYAAIAPIMLNHTKNRLISMERFPLGIAHEGFYQKDAGCYFPDWIATKRLKKKDGSTNYVYCTTAATLVYLANQGCITLHTWLSCVDKINYPNRMIFDLDPAKKDFQLLCVLAKQLRLILQNYGLHPFVMTTGSKGLHIVVPIKRTQRFDRVKIFARNIAQELIEKKPTQVTLEVRKNKREGKVFIDTLRNEIGQTGVAPYAVRPIEGAPIATPLLWHELDEKNLHAQRYTINNIFARLERIGDPWGDINNYARALPKI